MRRYQSMTINIGDVIDDLNGLKYDLNINSDRRLADLFKGKFGDITSGDRLNI